MIFRSLLADDKLHSWMGDGVLPGSTERFRPETATVELDFSCSTKPNSFASSLHTNSFGLSTDSNLEVVAPVSGSSKNYETNLRAKPVLISSRKQKRPPTFEVAFGLWFTRSMLMLSGYGSSWQNIRFARIIRTFPRMASQLVLYIQDDNAPAVQEMFSQGKATPYDRIAESDHQTTSLLEVGFMPVKSCKIVHQLRFIQLAALYHSLEVCKLLLHEGSPCEQASQG